MLLLGLALATRPLWQTVHQSADDPGVPFVGRLQAAQGQPVDGSRTYAEWSLAWLTWWAGPALVIGAWVTFAVLSGRAVRWLLAGGRPRSMPGWLVPATIGFGSGLLALWRPGITPDHPWADRRLVCVLLPLVVVAGTASLARVVRRARRRFPATLFVLTGVLGVAVVLAPPIIATSSFVGQRTERGELAAVDQVCAALRPGDAVVAVDSRGFNEWPQVIRGICGHPAAALNVHGAPLPPAQLRSSAQRLADLVTRSGGRLVLLTAADDPSAARVLAGLGLAPREVTHLVTVEDQRRLVTPPWGSARLVIGVWLAPWQPAGG